MRVGVLALQGDVREHVRALGDLDCDARSVRTIVELDDVDAIVLPGGESTAIAHLLRTSGLLEPLAARLRAGMPALGTCAGLVLLARSITDGRPDQPALGLLDVEVRRNGYGRQVASFEATCDLDGVGPVPAVFIRAPRITYVAPDVEVLATLDLGDGGAPHAVAVRRGPVLGCSFHPELTDDRSVHGRFLAIAEEKVAVASQ